jgi:hypothetical protein
MIDKKHVRAILIPLFIGMFLIIAAVMVMTLSSGYDVVVKDTDGGFYKAHGIFIAGNVFVCSRDSLTFTTRNDAFQSREENRDFAIISMKKIQFIEVISRPDDTGPALGTWQPSLNDYIGDYTVNAAGNHGYLSLRATAGGYLYGSIRFPEWGRGATEYLKYVRLVNGKIYFTRSVTTPQELQRIGGNSYFIQEYSGEYLRSGNLIRGYYTIQGTRKAWEATKNR